MLTYVYDIIMDTIDGMKNIYPFLLGDGLDRMFKGSLFLLFVGYSIIEILLDYFNGDSSVEDSQKK